MSTDIYDQGNGRELYTGPRGGRYYLSPTGRKIYIQNPRVQAQSQAQSQSQPQAQSPRSRTRRSGTWIKPNAPIDERQQKYCRCVLEVSSKQTDKCLDNIAQRKTGTFGPGTDCYNVYSVCAASTGTSTGRGGCSKHYNFNEIPDEFLLAYLKLHGKKLPSVMSHENLVTAVEEETQAAGG